MLRSFSTKIVITAACLLSATQAYALGDQWYIGIGGGGSILVPDPEDSSLGRQNDSGSVGTVLVGRDFDTRSSGQLQFFSLGNTDFDNGTDATYSAVEASLLYRFYDSRDNRNDRPIRGVSIYGRFGLGALDRDTEIPLEIESEVYFGVGVGLESYITNNFGVRLETQFIDEDVVNATLSLIGRFGGLRRDLARRPPPINRQVTQFPQASELPETAEVPESAQVPQTALRPEVAQLPQTAVVPLPETAQLPEVAPLPETAQLPQVTPLPETAQLPQVAPLPEAEQLPETAQLPQVTLFPDSEQPLLTAEPSRATEALATTETGIEDTLGLADVEIMALPLEASEPVNTPEESSSTLAQATNLDSDGDGLLNSSDNCPDSPAGFPVKSDGCSELEGEITGLQFESDSVTLLDSTTSPLVNIARLLNQNPQARIELVAHTDNTGVEAEQSRRTRGRLRSIGVFLIDQGVRSEQLVLRSFGAKRPKVDNNNIEGRRINNRVEVFERPF